MKRIFIIAASALAFALTAFGGQAHAASLPSQTYVSSDNKIFSLDNVRKITSDSGYITLTFVNGESSYTFLADAGGAVFANIKATQPTFVATAVAPNVLYNPAYAKYITCNASGGTLMIGWYVGGSEWVSDPSCSAFNAIKAATH